MGSVTKLWQLQRIGATTTMLVMVSQYLEILVTSRAVLVQMTYLIAMRLLLTQNKVVNAFITIINSRKWILHKSLSMFCGKQLNL